MNKLDYYIIPENLEKSKEIFQKLIGELKLLKNVKIKETQEVGFPVGFDMDKEESIETVITYKEWPFTALLSYKKVDGQLIDKENISQMLVVFECQQNDTVTIPLIKSYGKEFEFRIFNPRRHCYLPTDPEIFDIEIDILKPKFKQIFAERGFSLLFYYPNYLPLFAKKNGDKSIHIINPYMIKYFSRFGTTKEEIPEFSYKVASDIDTFVSMFDFGLIPLNFYDYYGKNIKIINHSGFDIKII